MLQRGSLTLRSQRHLRVVGMVHVSAQSSRFTLLRRQPLIEIAEYASIRIVCEKSLCVNVPLRNPFIFFCREKTKAR